MSVIGSVLLDPLSVAKVLQFLHPEDFYRENNGQIYRAALDLFAAGEPIDKVTLAAQLQDHGAGSTAWAAARNFASMQGGGADRSEHRVLRGRIVKEKARKRRLISAARTSRASATTTRSRPRRKINQAQSLVCSGSRMRPRTSAS